MRVAVMASMKSVNIIRISVFKPINKSTSSKPPSPIPGDDNTK